MGGKHMLRQFDEHGRKAAAFAVVQVACDVRLAELVDQRPRRVPDHDKRPSALVHQILLVRRNLSGKSPPDELEPRHPTRPRVGLLPRR